MAACNTATLGEFSEDPRPSRTAPPVKGTGALPGMGSDPLTPKSGSRTGRRDQARAPGDGPHPRVSPLGRTTRRQVFFLEEEVLEQFRGSRFLFGSPGS